MRRKPIQRADFRPDRHVLAKQPDAFCAVHKASAQRARRPKPGNQHQTFAPGQIVAQMVPDAPALRLAAIHQKPNPLRLDP